MKRLAGLVLAVAAVAVPLSGCGAGEAEPQANVLAPGQVVQRFKSETGTPLQRAATADEAWEQLSFGLDPSKSELDRYGIFSVYVAKRGHFGALDSLLRDKATKKPLERDSRGVYWELDSNSDTWVAYKRYARNVVLVWFSGSTARSADTRWERLDRILTGLAG